MNKTITYGSVPRSKQRHTQLSSTNYSSISQTNQGEVEVKSSVKHFCLDLLNRIAEDVELGQNREQASSI